MHKPKTETKTRSARRRGGGEGNGSASAAIDRIDYSRAVAAVGEVIDWALDVAVALTRGDDEERASVERVREYARAQLAGDEALPPIADLLFTAGLIVGAIERDAGLDGFAEALVAQLAMPTPTSMREPCASTRCPIAPPTVLRRVPASRVAAAFDPFVRFAA